MKKIVITVATYWPKTDGVQMVTQYQAEGLAKLGYKVTLITSEIDGCPHEENLNGVDVIRINAHNFYYWHKGDKKQYRSIVLKETTDAVALIAVCLQSFSADWILNVLPNIQCKKILYLHGMPDFKIHINNLNNLYNLVKTCFRNARWKLFYLRNNDKIMKFDAITHLFKYDNSYIYFQKKGFKNNYIIENACDDLFFETTHNNKNKYFLYVGNFCKRKNQELLLRTFYKLKDNTHKLVLIGSVENEYCKRLKKIKLILDEKFEKKDVEILDNVSREKIIEYTKNAVACIMTSNYEYFPITIIEAMASGVPFISTNVGIVRYLPGGIIVNKQNDIIYWMDFFIHNPEYAMKIGEVGNDYAKDHMKIRNKVHALENIIVEK